MAGLKRLFRNPLAVILGLSALFFVFFFLISSVLLITKGERTVPGKLGRKILKDNPPYIGIIEINGVIMDSKKPVRNIERFVDDDDIVAIVVRLNSPGGAVAPSQEILEAVKGADQKKPVVVSMSSVAASGAFYVAMGGRKVFANPGTITGSIGVIMDFMNLEKLYEWAKIKRYSLKTGKHKAAGSDYEEMSPESRELLQEMLMDVLGQFKTAVAQGRKLGISDVDPIADGRVFSGARAKELKLVDEVGTFQDALVAAAELAGKKGKPKAVYPDTRRRNLLFESIFEDRDPDDDYDESRSAAFGQAGMDRIIREVVGGLAGSSAGEPLSTTRKMPPGIYWLWKEGI